MNEGAYIPEKYWDNVAVSLAARAENRLVAGDDDPFYRYKRRQFLRLLNKIEFSDKTVLEVGPGPGGNLIEIGKHHPFRLCGADLSADMLALCRKNLQGMEVELVKTDGVNLPFANESFEVVITSTVLQHITDESMLEQLVNSICRIASGDVFIFERIEKKPVKKETNIGRTATQYEHLFKAGGMEKVRIEFLEFYWSSLICGIIRKTFNSRLRNEGERQSVVSIALQKLGLLIGRPLDYVFPRRGGFAMLHFSKFLAKSQRRKGEYLGFVK